MAQKMDMAKVLAMLSQSQETKSPLKDIEQSWENISYIKKDGKLDTRSVRIFVPKKAEGPLPLIYVPHYEMTEDAAELRAYLAEGWAVASPAPFSNDYNGTLADDDLVFNHAALCTLRWMDGFDHDRIAVVGGSAGGYMTLMLNGLTAGLCCSVSNGSIANIYFDFEDYFKKSGVYNLKALAEMKKEPEKKKGTDSVGDGSSEADQEKKPEDPGLTLMKKLMNLPVPFLAAVSGMFLPNADRRAEESKAVRAGHVSSGWEAVTGIGVCDRFGSPIMMNHSTSDVLVPVDQITRRYTYEKPGESLPEGYDLRLPKDLPGHLGMAIDERLPKDETIVRRIEVPEGPQPESVLPYDRSKRFNINIFDDGPAEGYGSHSARMDVGRRDDIPYLKDLIESGAGKNAVLTPAMLKFFLRLWEGRSIALPAHTGVNDRVYGSLTVYREEIVRELQMFTADALDRAFEEVTAGEDETEKMKQIMDEIRRKL